ncbi:transglutaminase-like domain-containing protein [[Clostridium] polysaccharolyticum]|nr:transglutaminase-like domain-containing protein [[Clostridium] polysaccharolyticum]
MKKVIKGILAVVLSGCLIGSLSINMLSFRDNQTQNDKVNRYISDQLAKQAEEAKKEKTYEEDGFKVGDEYEIRSTKAISDAYINNDESKLTDEEKKTLNMAKAIMKKVLKDNMTVYQKEEAIYNWMFKNIKCGSGSVVSMPSSLGNNYTPFGVLTGKNAVCVGYATTFRMFMHMLGLECHVVHNEYHSWDLVKLDDGEWYHTDIYTDVSSNSQYRNFNMTDAMARDGHEWDASCLPVAEGLNYSYPVQHNEKLKTVYDVPQKIKKMLDKKKKSGYYSFKSLTKKELQAADIIVRQVKQALEMLGGFDSYDVSGSWYDGKDGTYILGIYISNYDEEEETNFDPKMNKKVTEEINKAFDVKLDPLN